MSVTGAIIAGVGAAGSIGGAAIASHGAGKAAQTQADAATQAAQIQANQDQKALDLQTQQYGNSQREFAPFLNTGYTGLAQLGYELGLSGFSPTSSTNGVPQSNLKQPLATAKTATDPYAQFGKQSFDQLVHSGNSLISPNKETTDAWTKQGIPFRNVISSDGRSVAVRTDQAAPGADKTGIQDPSQYGVNIPSNLSSLVNTKSGSFGDLTKPFGQTFSAPTGLTMQNDPGYMARLQLGTDAVERSAAARGNVLTGGTLKDLNQFAQDYGSNEYGNVYNRALGTYTTNYNAYNNDQLNKYNKLAALAGLGQSSTNQLTNLGAGYANSGTNILVNSGNAQASGINNAAAARGSGYAASGNIWGSTLSNTANNVSQLYQLSQLGKGGTPGVGYSPEGNPYDIAF